MHYLYSLSLFLSLSLSLSLTHTHTHMHTHTVDSNDSLYAGEQKFVAEISQLVSTLLNLVLKQLHDMQNVS